MEPSKIVPGSSRLSNDEARKRFLRTRQGAHATQHHDVNVADHALRQSRALAGKLPPVFPSAPNKRRAGYTIIEILTTIAALAIVSISFSFVFLVFRFLYYSV